MNDQAGSARAVPAQGDTLTLIETLCQLLRTEDVNYCHWKSNIALDRSASGDNDLDILIDRGDAHVFLQILHGLGFKEARSRLPPQMPGVLDYYGYDGQTDRFVHVHAHYQLIVGHDRTKNYHLPVEKAFLESVTQGALFKVPDPAFEYIIYVLRMVLKYSTSDNLLRRPRELSGGASKELVYLRASVKDAVVYDVLQRHFTFLERALFDDCVFSLSKECTGRMRMRTIRRLQNSLRANARCLRVLDGYLKFWRRFARAARRRMPGGLPRRRLVNGGMLIALVGGDGAGKSTAISALRKWLVKEFATRNVHLGRPRWSLTTYATRSVLKVLSLPGRLRGRSGAVAASNKASYSQLLRSVCTARDRYLTYVKARRFASNGGIVLCDRFPLPRIMSLDGPQAKRIVESGQNNAITRWLAGIEEYWYSRISSPDILIVLSVDPESAARRKTDENSEHVRTRVTQVSQSDWGECGAQVIDAGRPQAEVLAKLKSLIWSRL
jgi:thymidylate kinase